MAMAIDLLLIFQLMMNDDSSGGGNGVDFMMNKLINGQTAVKTV